MRVSVKRNKAFLLMSAGPVFWHVYQSCLGLVVTWDLIFIFDRQCLCVFFFLFVKSVHQDNSKIQKFNCNLWETKDCFWQIRKQILQVTRTLSAHRLSTPPSASIVLMKHILLWGPPSLHLCTGLISFRKLWPLWRQPGPRLNPDRSFHQHPAPNELEDGGQREERKEANKGKTTSVGPLY